MKFITALLFCALMLGACHANKSEYATIRGHYEGERTGKEIHLCKVEHGQTSKIATATIQPDGKFGFSWPVDHPELYVINVVWTEQQQLVREDHNLKRYYLDGGVELDIHLTDGKYELLKSNCDKNILLSEWNTYIDSVFTYSHGFRYNQLNYTHFFPLLPTFVNEATDFTNKISVSDANFEELMKLMVEVDMNNAALSMLYTPRTKHPEPSDFPEYYDYLLNQKELSTERILELPAGYSCMRRFVMFKMISLPEEAKANWYETELEQIEHPLLKGYFGVENIERFQSLDKSFLDYKKLIEPYLGNEYLKTKVEEYELSINSFTIGSDAFDIEGKDINNKSVKLSDFKGKVVYVDAWATWCAPCKGEIPALKKLEQKYHNKDVVFLSISLDSPKKIGEWKHFVKDESLKGVQLIADDAFNSPFAKAYRINSIPRFMLFDKEGKVVSTDAPRPSNIKAEAMIKDLL
ncbi:AhpC/TSA family protein [Carboxylicivirga sediminis]|uniref:AhpC/TSA family protein n=1 Tax=Carboxylicivirga sediminis TaxID=2006564 RepID=A0A941EZ36_9BACT|nr:TlpA disulfide reductase family protein [Carboxylicivirga sediminis]MBR8534276.1 AhpC/TSA family protein [Carboxylicivirga sediminis]